MLTCQQIQQLAQFLIDDHGSRLSEPDVIECIHAMLDDVAGFEAVDTRQTTIDQIWSAYHGEILERQHGCNDRDE